MKTKPCCPLILRILVFGFLFSQLISCDKKDNEYKAPCKTVIEASACGIEDIGNNLNWLNDIISESLNDKTGNYLGTIWCKKYNNTDYIVTNMMLGSGGLAYHTFNCSGDFTSIDDIEFYKSLSEEEIIWKTFCED